MIGMVVGLAVYGAGLYIYLRGTMRLASFAVPAAAFVTVSGAVSWGFMFYILSARYRSRHGWHFVIGSLFGSGAGVLVLSDAQTLWHLPVPATAAVAVGVTLVTGTVTVVMTRSATRRALTWSIHKPTDRRAAQDTYEASREAQKHSRKSVEQKTARLNAAQAAILRSYGDDAPDGLVEATDELHRMLVDDPPDDWLTLLVAAIGLVDAISTKAGKQGDLAGYPAALQLLAEVVDRVPADAGALAVMHSLRADYHASMADRLPSGPEADEHVAAAIADLWAAIDAVTRSTRDMLPGLYADLGILLARVRGGPGDLEAGIAMCRTGARFAGHSRLGRARTWRSLGTLLVCQAGKMAANLPEDAPEALVAAAASSVHVTLAEAERVLRQARRLGGSDGRAEALRLLAQARTARAMIFGRPRDDRRAAQACRSAARAAAGSDPLDRVRIGTDWVGWAETTQDVRWCAEAYAYLMSAVPSVVAVRYLAGERDRVLAGLQSTAEEAGYWLTQAGRLGDAAVALELGRAVSLSEMLGRERPDLDAALGQAGRPDLLRRYREAVEACGFAAATAPSDGLSSAAQRAWARYDAVTREIAAAVNAEMPGVRVTLGELAEAAADGPIVYLVAATRSGYAVIVPNAGPPESRPLPQLTRANVSGWTESFLRGTDRTGIAEVVRSLWTAGIDALATELPVGALVTVVPVGLLSFLPIHAAGGPTAPGQAPTDWTFLTDRVTVRYSPNARTLLRTRHRAGAFSREALTLFAVAAPDGVPERPLPHTVREVTEIAGRWTRADTIISSTLVNVGAMLAGHTVWHLACHCDARPDRILDSALLLTNEQVTLRAILAMPPAPRRLAVLSACETHVSGSELPDEAMGLPAGLLHAGFAGVVASHWPVGDRPTAFLMTRFHDLWHRHGLPPATALAEAQRWLRTATYADLHAYLGGILDLPADRSPEGWARWKAVRPYGHPYHWAAFALTGY